MNKIKFHTNDPQVMKDFPPKPISEDLPYWFEKLNDNNEFNVSHCPPVMDWISSGYVFYNAWETLLEEKVLDFRKGIELESQNQRLSIRKTTPNVFAGECLPVKGIYSYFRMETDYKIVTPPGYSCLVMQPFYDFNDKYTVMPGIVDTDKHDYFLSAMAYTKEKELRIFPGERILQVIPFKREDWQMQIESQPIYSKLTHYIRGAYKKLFHTKKVYK